jgi:hypothetical protein
VNHTLSFKFELQSVFRELIVVLVLANQDNYARGGKVAVQAVLEMEY